MKNKKTNLRPSDEFKDIFDNIHHNINLLKKTIEKYSDI